MSDEAGSRTNNGDSSDPRAWTTQRSAPASDATVNLTPEELSVQAAELELPLVPLLHYDPIAVEGAEPAAELEVLTRAQLVKREILSAPNAGEVAEPIRALMELLATPRLLLRVEATFLGAEAQWQFACTPNAVIEIAEMSDRSWRFSALALSQLVARIIELTGLVDRPEITVAPISLPTRTLLALPGFIDDDERAMSQLLADGANETSARAALNALRAAHTAAAVTVLSRPERDRLVGGELAWIDAVDLGLWITPTPDTTDWNESSSEPGPEAELRPTTAEWIRTELRSYLP